MVRLIDIAKKTCSPTNIFKSFTPPQKGAGMMLEGADKATCEKLAGILAAKHII